MHVPVITLSKQNDKKLLELLKSEFKRTIQWNNYRSQMTIQPHNNNINYLIYPMLTKVNRLFVFSFAGTDTGDHRDSFLCYYVPNATIKNFNVLIDGEKNFLTCQEKITKILLRWVEIMTIQLVIYLILLISKKIIN